MTRIDVEIAERNGHPVRHHIPLCRPSVPDIDAVTPRLGSILESGVLTNGPTVREFEERAAERLGVTECVAVSSCTTGLMLLLRTADLLGDVVIPAFTFTATAHAVAWNGLRPVFADVDPDTLTLSPTSVEAAAGPRTSAVIATHVFGTPCDVDGLADVCSRLGLRLFYDAAHAFGSRSADRPIGGFGDAEVFSLTPTKLVVAGEGGVIATNDRELANRCRTGREYANPGNYDCEFVGLNGRLSEIHSLLAILSLSGLDERIERRNEIGERYRKELAGIPGITFPAIRPDDLSTYKDFTILIDFDEDGRRRDGVSAFLDAVGIETRMYYSPPVHLQRAYLTTGNGGPPKLPVTERACRSVLTLPIWSEMDDDQIDSVVSAVADAMAG